jgi:hypothetical protein
MPENLFEPGQKSHCIFAPDLWCDYWKPSAEPFAPFEFFCDVIPQTVRVVLPVAEGKNDAKWQKVYSTIESVWQDRQVGFHCRRADARAWIEEKPCDACHDVRQAHVVVLEYMGDDARATVFRDMAERSNQALKVLANLGPAPRKRVIVINSSRISPPAYFRNVYDWIDYAGPDGKPDLALLRREMETIARQQDLFQSGGSPIRFPEEAFFDDEVASQIRFVESGAPSDDMVVRDDEGQFVIRFLQKEDLAPEPAIASTSRVDQPVVDAAAEEAPASIERARELASRKDYAEAFRELVAAAKAGASEREVRDLERELVFRMSARDLADVYFRGLTGRPRPSDRKLEWKGGDLAEGELTVEGEDSDGLGSSVVVYAADRLDEDAAERLRRRVRTQSDRAVLIVIDACNASICEKFAELRKHKVYEIHVADLRRWALGRRPVSDGLAERGSYRRAEDLYLRGLHDPVANEEKYIGRRPLLERLQRLLNSGNGFAIHGLSRAGKSSTLWRLARAGVKGHVIAVVDFQGHVPDDSADIYVRTLRAIRDAVLTTYPAKRSAWPEVTKGNRLFTLTPKDSVDAFRSSFESGLKTLAAAVRRHVDSEFEEHFDLLFDDVGSLSPAATQTFMQQIRSLMDNGFLAVGMSGPAFSLQDELEGSSPLPRLSDCFVPGLDDEDCCRLIRSIGHGMYAYFNDEAVAEIVRASGGHPLLIRYLCSVILEGSSDRSAVIGARDARFGIDLAVSMKNVRRWLDRTLDDMKHLKGGAGLLQAIAQESRRVATLDRRALEQTADYEARKSGV